MSVPTRKNYLKKAEDYPTHPIQVVARRAALSADVIRAWERRYQAVTPTRSETDRRLYSDNDIKRLTLLSRAVSAGRRIGDVAKLSLEELTELVEADQVALEQAPVNPKATVKSSGEDRAREHFDACLKAVRELDSIALESVLSKASIELSAPVLLEEVVHTLMKDVGERWRTGALRLCHEHIATATFRTFLGAMLTSSNVAAGSGPVVLVTTPEGQSHELGALMVAVTAAVGGWNALYLGPNTPSDEIVFSVNETAARAVALSICYPGDDPRLPGALRRLRRQLPADVAVLVGGAAAPGYEPVLAEIDAICPDTLNALQVELDKLRER